MTLLLSFLLDLHDVGQRGQKLLVRGLQRLDVNDAALIRLRGGRGSDMQLFRIFLQKVVGRLGDGIFGRNGFGGMRHGHRDDHLVLPERDRVDDDRLDLLGHLGVRGLDHTDLRRGLHGDRTGQFQIIDLLLKTIALIAEVTELLRVFCLAGLLRDSLCT